MGNHYEPIESEEKIPGLTDGEDVSFLRSMRRVPNISWWTTIRQHGHIISVYMVLSFSLLALITEPLWKRCDCKDPSLGPYCMMPVVMTLGVALTDKVAAPAMDVITYEDVDFGKYFAADNRSPYMEKPSREIDEMWKELYNFGLTGLTPEEASQLPEPTAHLPHDNNTYVVSLSVFHQLHCVNHLRKALYPDEYPGLWEYHKDGTVNHDTILALHWAAEVAKGAYIIEYAEDHSPAALLEYLAADATKRRDFNFTLFKGLSVQFHDVKNAAQHASAILDMPGIKSVWPVLAYDLPQHDVLWSGGSQSSSSATTERESVRQVSANDSFSTHMMTQVDKLRNEGIVGSGIRVAVIDTGVDYLHPALGGCFGPGCLVSWGADLVGDAYNGTNHPVSGPDPMDCNGHGTHVAGIIAAQPGNPVGMVGAATGVSLGAYRVFGCSGKVTNDVVIAAYNMAYEAGADIIITSIGGASGWAEEPWAVAVDRIVEKGVSCLLSAGNSGSFGLFYASTAANGHKATATASVDNTEVPILLQNSTYAVGDTFDTPIPFGFSTATASNWGNVTLPLWAVNFDTSDPANGCDVFPGTTPDLSGHIVLIRRGTCTFTQKSTNAAAKGAKYIIFYSDIIGTIPITAVVPGIEGMAMVTASQGAEWISKLEEGTNVLVHMVKPTGLPSIVVSERNTVTPGFLSVDSSWGPTYELDIKPQFAAPGGMVLSTFPRSKGYYAVLTGTSMACPLAAGIYALLMEARGTKDPGELETVISSTSMPAKFHDGRNESQFLAPVPQQGSGLIQAYDAARVQTVLSVSSLSFNDTDNFTPMRKFTIRNTSARPIRYELGHTGANTAYTFAAPSDIVPDAFPNDLVESYAEISFNPSSSVTIPAGQELAFTVHLASPAGLDGRRLPVYSGYVTVTSAGGDNLSVPYMGVSGSMRSLKVLDSASTFLTSASDGTGSPAAENKTWTLPPLDTPSNSSAGIREYPKLSVKLVMGSALVRMYVLVDNADGNDWTTVGETFQSPLKYQPRGTMSTTWDGRLASGTLAGPGRYKIIVKALHIFGNSEMDADYDEAETVAFSVSHAP